MKNKSVVAGMVLIALGVGLWMGGGLVWNKLLEMHGMKPDHRRASVDSKPATWPETETAKVAQGWVEAFSTGDDAMRSYILNTTTQQALRDHPVEVRIENYHKLHERFKTLKLVSVENSKEGQLEVMLASADGGEHHFTFHTQAEAPYKLLDIKMTENHLGR